MLGRGCTIGRKTLSIVSRRVNRPCVFVKSADYRWFSHTPPAPVKPLQAKQKVLAVGFKNFNDLLRDFRWALNFYNHDRTTPAYQDAWNRFGAVWNYAKRASCGAILRNEIERKDFGKLLIAINRDESLSLRDRLDRVHNVLRRMRECGLQMDEFSYNQLAIASGYRMTYTQAVEFQDRMRKDGIQLTVLTYSALFTGLLRVPQSGSIVMRLLSDMKDAKLPPDIPLYTMLIDHFAGKGDFGRANHIIELMRMQKLKLNEVTYTTLINAYIEAGDFDQVEQYFKMMQADGLDADAHVLSTLMNFCLKSGNLEKAEEMLEDLRKKKHRKEQPSKHMYTLVIGGYGAREDMVNADRWFQQMIADGVHPDQVACTSLIGGYVRIGDSTKADEVFHNMTRYGLQPDAYAYAVMINGYVKRKDLRSTAKMLREMHHCGVSMETVPFSRIIKLYLLRGDDDAALDTFSALISAVSEKKARMEWTHIIQFLVRLGRLTAVRAWYDALRTAGMEVGKRTAGFVWSPGSSWKAEILREFGNQGRFKAGLAVWRYLRRIEKVIDESTICAYVDLCRMDGAVDNLRLDLESMVEEGYALTAPIYASWMVTLISRGHARKATRLLMEDMPDNGIHPTVDTFVRVVTELRRQAQWAEARHVLDYLASEEPELEPEVNRTLVEGLHDITNQ
ncbi:pentatricopeptide repeat domain-containing protein [Spizellomyces punctatus DAOM BR117]|uniref:Pentatricopeptide repeat domain-containing protein n=1 Tax=Spizellomyces punctatus (strain DAOM BR117) TaxID=645134 RepID=A0A0L0HQE9_SPIPD|nr:pentatricopeptide repeat domain-containing protein [Spizellomyces punctatus DAOM BR117]KND03611.1 pentatricopeptide repeat domain-containing protein [Spizellomyces punctatus DAOM BR117]|eukprot:XP_016611650.1 pentatricopeptide repeat domain-containing protein [Spizellomyces punctatus DAOM BR117]